MEGAEHWGWVGWSPWLSPRRQGGGALADAGRARDDRLREGVEGLHLESFRARLMKHNRSEVRGPLRPGVKDAGATGASIARTAGAQGQGSGPQAVIRASRDRSLDTRRCYL